MCGVKTFKASNNAPYNKSYHPDTYRDTTYHSLILLYRCSRWNVGDST